MRKNIITILTISSSLLLISLKYSEAQIETVKGELLKSIDEFGNGEFVAKVSDIASDNERFYFLDQSLKKVIITDQNLTFLNAFGKSGPGPEELQQPMQLNVNGDSSLFIFDLGQKILDINRFTGAVRSSIRFRHMVMHHATVVLNGNLFFSDFTSSNMDVLQYDLKNEKELEGIEGKTGSMGRHILSDGQYLISISGENEPIIKTYDFDGKQVHEQNLMDVPVFKGRSGTSESPLKVNGGNVKRSAQGTIVIYDAQIYEGKLFMLIPTYGKNDKLNNNTILILEKTGTEWQAKTQIKLSDAGSYNSFQLFDGGNKLVTFESYTNSIQTFNIAF